MLLIFAIFTVSFGQIFLKGKLYYIPQKVDSNGVVSFYYSDYSQITQFYKAVTITNFQSLKVNSTEYMNSFSIFPLDNFAGYRTTQPLTQAEVSCEGVQATRISLLYGLYGYAIRFYYDIDTSPSITGLIRSSANKVEFKNVPTDKRDLAEFTDYDIPRSCQGIAYSQTFYGLKNFGVVSASCLPNTVIPTDLSNCTNGTISKSYLAGYTIGQFEHGDVNTMKSVILRFGPVLNSNIGLYLGWETDSNNTEKWIIVKSSKDSSETKYDKQLYKISKEQIIQTSQYAGTVIFDSFCLGKTQQTSIYDCPCPQNSSDLKYDPRFNTSEPSDDPDKESSSGRLSWQAILILSGIGVFIILFIASCCACSKFCPDSVKDCFCDCCDRIGRCCDCIGECFACIGDCCCSIYSASTHEEYTDRHGNRHYWV